MTLLFPATLDQIELALAVEHRFLDLTHTHMRLRGVTLPIPRDLDCDLLLWRQAMVRFRQGDQRTNVDERNAVRRVAQWTLDMNCDLRNQPRQVLQWKD